MMNCWRESEREQEQGEGDRKRRRRKESAEQGESVTLGDLKENWFLFFPIKHSTHTRHTRHCTWLYDTSSCGTLKSAERRRERDTSRAATATDTRERARARAHAYALVFAIRHIDRKTLPKPVSIFGENE
jgi:hypothetical protein